MAQLLFSNNANTTLAGAITATSLSVALSAGSGVEFPAPGAGQYFVGSLFDAATGLLTEIVWVTAVSGDTLTIARAKEGTTALAWNAGDIFVNNWTAGQAGQMLQLGVDPPDNFGQATLTVAGNGNNSYALTWNLTQTQHVQGNPQGLVQFLQANTSSTVTLTDGTVIQPLVKLNGANPSSGDAFGYIPVFDDGTNWRFAIPVASDYPQITSGNPTLYVRTDGSDSNNGSANTAAGAFATIQAALNYAVSRFVTQGKTLTIQLGIAGTYAAPTLIPAAAGALVIAGSITNNGAGYNISGSGPAGSPGVINVSGTNIAYSGVSLLNTSSSTATLAALAGGVASLGYVTLNHSVAFSGSDLLAYPGGSISIVGPITFGASANIAVNAMGGSISFNSGVAVTIASGNAYSTFAIATNCGTALFNSGVTFSGSATGQRYGVALNGVINTFGAGATYLPGSTAGNAVTGGQYA